jgi:hypothetical protein
MIDNATEMHSSAYRQQSMMHMKKKKKGSSLSDFVRPYGGGEHTVYGVWSGEEESH